MDSVQSPKADAGQAGQPSWLELQRIISEKEAARLLGISHDTLRRQVARGEGPRREGKDLLGRNIRLRNVKIEITAARRTQLKLIDRLITTTQRFKCAWAPLPTMRDELIWRLLKHYAAWKAGLKGVDVSKFFNIAVAPIINSFADNPSLALGADAERLLREFSSSQL